MPLFSNIVIFWVLSSPFPNCPENREHFSLLPCRLYSLTGLEIGRRQTISTISKGRFRPDFISLAREVDDENVHRYF